MAGESANCSPWIADEVADDVIAVDVPRIARSLGGIIANDERIALAIRNALTDEDQPVGSACIGVMRAVVDVLLTANGQQ